MRRLWPFILVAILCAPVVGDDNETTYTARIRAESAMEQTIERPAISGPLEEVIAELSELAGVSIEPDWQAIEATGAQRDARVVMRSSRSTVGQLLDIALLQASAEDRPLAWYAEGPSVHVTTQMRAIYGRRRFPTADARPARRDRAQAADAPREESIRFRFEEAHLEEVVEFFRTITGANFHVNWQSLEAVGVTRDTPVSMNLSDVSVGRALDVLCQDLSGPVGIMDRVHWVVEGGVIKIATGEALNRRTITRVFDVADLLMVAPDYEAPAVTLGTTERTDRTEDQIGLFERRQPDTNGRNGLAGEAELMQQRREDLVSMIRESIGEDMWQPIGKGSIRLIGNQLVITQTPLGFRMLRDTVQVN